MKTSPDLLSVELAERIDAICDEFETAWKEGRSPALETFLAQVPPAEQPTALAGLLRVEIELRRRAGEALEASSYRQRFPQFDSQIQTIFSEAQSVVDTSVSQAPATVAFGQDPAAETVEEPVPASIGRFQILGKIGEGAFGQVFKAHDPQLDRDVAIKVPRRGTLSRPGDLERFLRESKAAANMHHPNICPVYEVGTADGRPYIVMSLVPGKSLAEHIKQSKEPMSIRQAVLIVRKLAQALELAHSKGIVHRDLKPANIILDRERKDVVVMDFGLARDERRTDIGLTVSGMVMGTPAYMSPEQARGDHKAIGPAADIYSLGVILYELLTRQRPFEGSMAEVLGKILHVEAPGPASSRPEVDTQLDEIVRKCLAKDPRQRYPSMRKLAEALTAYLKERAASVSSQPEAQARDSDVVAGLPTEPSDSAVDVVSAAASEPQVVSSKAGRPVERASQPVSGRPGKAVPRGSLIAAAAAFFALLLLGIIFFARTPTATVLINIDVDLKDPELVFLLDNVPVAAEKFAAPMELKVGKHELLVLRGEKLERKFTFEVKGGAAPSIAINDETPKAAPPTESAATGPGDSSDGFISLFNGRDLTGWEAPMRAESFSVDSEGNLVVAGDTPRVLNWLVTKQDYSDFRLRFEFIFGKGTRGQINSGIALRALPGRSGENGAKLKVQIRDDDDQRPRTGAVVFTSDHSVDVDQPAPLKPAGEWNAMEIEAVGPRLRVWLNGQALNDVDLSQIDRTQFRPKESYALLDIDRKAGRIGIQNFRGEIKFRDIRVKELGSESRGGDADNLLARFQALGAKITRDDKTSGNPIVGVSFYGTAKADDALLAELRHLPSLQSLNLWACDKVTDDGLIPLRELPNLSNLDLGVTRIGDKGVANLKPLAQLQGLNLSYTRVTDAGLAHLAGMTKLKSLALDSLPITDEGLKHLVGLTELTYLNALNTKIEGPGLRHLAGMQKLGQLWLSKSQVDDESLQHLEGLKSLRQVYLDQTRVTGEGADRLRKALPGCEITPRDRDRSAAAVARLETAGAKISRNETLPSKPVVRVGFEEAPTKADDPLLAELRHLPSLQSLDLSGCLQVTDDALAHVAHANLRHLDIHKTRLTGAGFRHLSDKASLLVLWAGDTDLDDAALIHLQKHKDLRHLGLERTKVTDIGLEHLKTTNLSHELWLHNTPITDAGLEHLKGLKLKWIGFNGTSIGDEGLAHLKDMKQLAILRMSHTKISDRGLESIADLTEMAELDLSGTSVGDPGLKHLARLGKLKSLNMHDTQVTDAGLNHLKGLTNLQVLGLSGPRVTKEGVTDLKMALPKCEVNYSDPNRAAAEFLVKNNAIIAGRLADGSGGIGDPKSVEQLPAAPFFVGYIEASRCEALNDEALAQHAAGLKQLKRINGNNTKFTGTGFAAFKESELEALDLSDGAFTNEGLKATCGIPTLKELHLNGHRDISDAGLVNLHQLPELGILNLSGTQVTSAGMKEVARCPKIWLLALRDTAIDDAAIEHFLKIKSLKSLELKGSKISPEGLKRLREGLPNCKVTPEP